MKDGSLVPRFGRARRDPTLAVLEGLHAVKHALRFGAELLLAVTPDRDALERLAGLLAADVAPALMALVRPVDPALYARLVPLPPATGVVALARRPATGAEELLAGAGRAPVVVLENPRDLGNMGACVRVAAAAGAGGLLCTGTHDPWHPDALRGAAGLHFALPVAGADSLEPLAAAQRPLLALDPEGEPLEPSRIPACAILAFGTERQGLSPRLLELADRRLRIPMRPGVSSLNLATAVAAVLFSWRMAGGG